MVLQAIEPTYLHRLEGNNRLRFEVAGLETTAREYVRLIDSMRDRCMGPIDKADALEVASIYGIPVTKNDPTLLLHIVGFYEIPLDHPLLIEKSSIYFYAINGDRSPKAVDGWREVISSKKPIKGAQKFGFHGAYHEIKGGLMNEGVGFGFGVLMNSIVNIVQGHAKTVHFLNVCLNLCEPVRIPSLVELVTGTMAPPNEGCHLFKYVPVTAKWDEWIHGSGKSSKKILAFRKAHRGLGMSEDSFNGTADEELQEIRQLSAIYGILKCKEGICEEL